jgi:hypothetical protein
MGSWMITKGDVESDEVQLYRELTDVFINNDNSAGLCYVQWRCKRKDCNCFRVI